MSWPIKCDSKVRNSAYPTLLYNLNLNQRK